MRKIAIAAALLLGTTTYASADAMFTLQNVTLSQAGVAVGTLTGTFATNDALTSVVSFDITASKSGTFAGFEYTTNNSALTVQTLPSFFQLDSTSGANELRLFFTTGLTAAGGTLSPTASYEFETSGGNRMPTGAVVRAAVPTSVPEPASLALLGLGVASLAAIRRRT